MSTPDDIILLLVEDDDIDAEGIERAFAAGGSRVIRYRII